MTGEARAGNAAFAASQDADSEGEGGRYYVWTEAEIDAVLGPSGAVFKQAYDVTASGNWEGRTILHRHEDVADCKPARDFGECRALLLAARERRPRPGRHDKVLAALCRAASVFDRPDWLGRAAAYAFVTAEMSGPDGRIQHAWRIGRVSAAGLLDDQAAMARAALALFEATGRASYLADAPRLADAAQAWFGAPGSGYFATAADAPDVPLGPAARPHTPGDSATPSGNAMMVEVLARLYHLSGDPAWRTRAVTCWAHSAVSALGWLPARRCLPPPICWRTVPSCDRRRSRRTADTGADIGGARRSRSGRLRVARRRSRDGVRTASGAWQARTASRWCRGLCLPGWCLRPAAR